MKKSISILIICLFLCPLFSAGVFAQDQENSMNIYRVYNSETGEHLLTPDHGEVERLVGIGWIDEGISWVSPTTGDPVYRLYNPTLLEHLYSTDLNEVNELQQQHGWYLDFVGAPAFYSGGSVPIYRLYNPISLRHHLTTDENEYNTLPAYNWVQEGVCSYALSN